MAFELLDDELADLNRYLETLLDLHRIGQISLERVRAELVYLIGLGNSETDLVARVRRSMPDLVNGNLQTPARG